jgi:hypothetical protein
MAKKHEMMCRTHLTVDAVPPLSASAAAPATSRSPSSESDRKREREGERVYDTEDPKERD